MAVARALRKNDDRRIRNFTIDQRASDADAGRPDRVGASLTSAMKEQNDGRLDVRIMAGWDIDPESPDDGSETDLTHEKFRFHGSAATHDAGHNPIGRLSVTLTAGE